MLTLCATESSDIAIAAALQSCIAAHTAGSHARAADVQRAALRACMLAFATLRRRGASGHVDPVATFLEAHGTALRRQLVAAAAQREHSAAAAVAEGRGAELRLLRCDSFDGALVATAAHDDQLSAIPGSELPVQLALSSMTGRTASSPVRLLCKQPGRPVCEASGWDDAWDDGPARYANAPQARDGDAPTALQSAAAAGWGEDDWDDATDWQPAPASATAPTSQPSIAEHTGPSSPVRAPASAPARSASDLPAGASQQQAGALPSAPHTTSAGGSGTIANVTASGSGVTTQTAPAATVSDASADGDAPKKKRVVKKVVKRVVRRRKVDDGSSMAGSATSSMAQAELPASAQAAAERGAQSVDLADTAASQQPVVPRQLKQSEQQRDAHAEAPLPVARSEAAAQPGGDAAVQSNDTPAEDSSATVQTPPVAAVGAWSAGGQEAAQPVSPEPSATNDGTDAAAASALAAESAAQQTKATEGQPGGERASALPLDSTPVDAQQSDDMRTPHSPDGPAATLLQEEEPAAHEWDAEWGEDANADGLTATDLPATAPVATHPDHAELIDRLDVTPRGLSGALALAEPNTAGASSHEAAVAASERVAVGTLPPCKACNSSGSQADAAELPPPGAAALADTAAPVSAVQVAAGSDQLDEEWGGGWRDGSQPAVAETAPARAVRTAEAAREWGSGLSDDRAAHAAPTTPLAEAAGDQAAGEWGGGWSDDSSVHEDDTDAAPAASSGAPAVADADAGAGTAPVPVQPPHVMPAPVAEPATGVATLSVMQQVEPRAAGLAAVEWGSGWSDQAEEAAASAADLPPAPAASDVLLAAPPPAVPPPDWLAEWDDADELAPAEAQMSQQSAQAASETQCVAAGEAPPNAGLDLSDAAALTGPVGTSTSQVVDDAAAGAVDDWGSGWDDPEEVLEPEPAPALADSTDAASPAAQPGASSALFSPNDEPATDAGGVATGWGDSDSDWEEAPLMATHTPAATAVVTPAEAAANEVIRAAELAGGASYASSEGASLAAAIARSALEGLPPPVSLAQRGSGGVQGMFAQGLGALGLRAPEQRLCDFDTVIILVVGGVTMREVAEVSEAVRASSGARALGADVPDVYVCGTSLVVADEVLLDLLPGLCGG